ncbi:uncharacterized protein with PQ loop repeat [Agromyces cerinus]|uniref:hypothetical protein n=1 Tax=Agromyces cerinus TaxID=33878 RepID=UPI001EF8E2DF|nr:hypothetical protein [Agromyces cerinus]MBM7832169.1 uncharacterized protein with PQ loop repeat [Agromyces cerinus]
MELAVLAGVVSTGLFAMSYLPMLVKAARTKDLTSYSLGNLATTNAGNAVYSVYVFSLPFGPIWFLHSFYLVASALMLVWFLRFRAALDRPRSATPCGSVRSSRRPERVRVGIAGGEERLDDGDPTV